MTYNFKKPEDVQEYLKNIYTEYRFGCEAEKHPNACHLLGDYEETVKRDDAKAASIYKENCDERNFPKSCAKYAGYKGHGKGCEKDLYEAYKYMKKSCDINYDMGCVRAGIMAVLPTLNFYESREEQVKIGMRMLLKACNEYNKDEACFQLAGIYLGGLKDDVQPNLTEAYKLSLKSCDLGNPYACANVAQMYMRGLGVEKNDALAEAFKEKALFLQSEITEFQRQIEFGV